MSFEGRIKASETIAYGRDVEKICQAQGKIHEQVLIVPNLVNIILENQIKIIEKI